MTEVTGLATGEGSFRASRLALRSGVEISCSISVCHEPPHHRARKTLQQIVR
jgi:hypothetical protein